MYKFKAIKSEKVIEYTISIERNTHLMVVEQKLPNEEYARYIRLTGQQIEKLKDILFIGSFSSTTIPVNTFSIEGGNVFVMTCREDNQVIRMAHAEMRKVFDYYDKHSTHIVRSDAKFRSRR